MDTVKWPRWGLKSTLNNVKEQKGGWESSVEPEIAWAVKYWPA